MWILTLILTIGFFFPSYSCTCQRTALVTHIDWNPRGVSIWPSLRARDCQRKKKNKPKKKLGSLLEKQCEIPQGSFLAKLNNRDTSRSCLLLSVPAALPPDRKRSKLRPQLRERAGRRSVWCAPTRLRAATTASSPVAAARSSSREQSKVKKKNKKSERFPFFFFFSFPGVNSQPAISSFIINLPQKFPLIAGGRRHFHFFVA